MVSSPPYLSRSSRSFCILLADSVKVHLSRHAGQHFHPAVILAYAAGVDGGNVTDLRFALRRLADKLLGLVHQEVLDFLLRKLYDLNMPSHDPTPVSETQKIS